MQNVSPMTASLTHTGPSPLDNKAAYWCCEFESRSGRGVQHYVITIVSDLRQVGGFLWGLQFPPPIKLTATIYSWVWPAVWQYLFSFPYLFLRVHVYTCWYHGHSLEISISFSLSSLKDPWLLHSCRSIVKRYGKENKFCHIFTMLPILAGMDC
jgi:hypothetical protein